jgi:hypothetical protein
MRDSQRGENEADTADIEIDAFPVGKVNMHHLRTFCVTADQARFAVGVRVRVPSPTPSSRIKPQAIHCTVLVHLRYKYCNTHSDPTAHRDTPTAPLQFIRAHMRAALRRLAHILFCMYMLFCMYIL